MAPLSTFCSLYNLFLLPILDEEFLKGEAIFSKIDLIKMSSNLKDVCLGIIQLMHPDTATTSTSNATSSFSLNLFDDDRDLYKNLAAKRMGGTNSTLNSLKKTAFYLKLKKQAACFTQLFQQSALLVQRLYTRDIRAGFCPEGKLISILIILINLKYFFHLKK